jgi:hypothetical protein
MVLTFLFLIAIILAIGIPVGLSYIIYRWIKKKGFDKRLRLLAFIPILIIGYIIYDAIYPSSEFYKTDFKEVTDMQFPENGKIKYKTASYPDLFGDYASSFLIELNENDLEKLENQLKIGGFDEKEIKMGSDQLDYIERKIGRKAYSKQYVRQRKNGKHYSVGFLDDNKSVIITRVSW